jgi:hypothetical protein
MQNVVAWPRPVEAVQHTIAETEREYGRETPPVGSYLPLVGAFNALFAGFLIVAHRSKRPPPQRIGLADVALLGIATHKLGRILAKDKVLSPLRAPFARYEKDAAPSEVDEQPRGQGLRRAIGQLVTCPYCMALWVAAFFNYGLVLRPAETRLVASIFTTVAIADWLHPLYQRLVSPPKEPGQ